MSGASTVMCSVSDAEGCTLVIESSTQGVAVVFSVLVRCAQNHAAGYLWVCFCLIQRCTNPGHQISMETKFCMVAPNVYGS